jgi:hypothetical protein
MDTDGRYYLNVNQIEGLLNLGRYSFLAFLAESGYIASDPFLRENAGFKNISELRTLWNKGLVVDRATILVQTQTGEIYRATDTSLVTQFIRFHDKKGHPIASILTDVLMSESLQIRCESVFIGTSPNVLEKIELTDDFLRNWELARGTNQSIHAAFNQFCIAHRLPGAWSHDRITKHIFNQSAEEARLQNNLVGVDKTIGLDHQEDVNGQLLVAKLKLKFMSYKKGTWKERVDRAFIDCQQ